MDPEITALSPTEIAIRYRDTDLGQRGEDGGDVWVDMYANTETVKHEFRSPLMSPCVRTGYHDHITQGSWHML